MKKMSPYSRMFVVIVSTFLLQNAVAGNRNKTGERLSPSQMVALAVLPLPPLSPDDIGFSAVSLSASKATTKPLVRVASFRSTTSTIEEQATACSPSCLTRQDISKTTSGQDAPTTRTLSSGISLNSHTACTRLPITCVDMLHGGQRH